MQKLTKTMTKRADPRAFALKIGISVLIIGGIAMLSVCSGASRTDQTWPEAKSEGQREEFDRLLNVVIDPDTGCHYLLSRGVGSGDIEPRRWPDGRQVCDESTK